MKATALGIFIVTILFLTSCTAPSRRENPDSNLTVTQSVFVREVMAGIEIASTVVPTDLVKNHASIDFWIK